MSILESILIFFRKGIQYVYNYVWKNNAGINLMYLRSCPFLAIIAAYRGIEMLLSQIVVQFYHTFHESRTVQVESFKPLMYAEHEVCMSTFIHHGSNEVSIPFLWKAVFTTASKIWEKQFVLIQKAEGCLASCRTNLDGNTDCSKKPFSKSMSLKISKLKADHFRKNYFLFTARFLVTCFMQTSWNTLI